MRGRRAPGEVRVTHIPTGETVTLAIERRGHTMRNRKEAAERIIASRLLAAKIGVRRSDAVVADYVLPDDEPNPHDLRVYRRMS